MALERFQHGMRHYLDGQKSVVASEAAKLFGQAAESMATGDLDQATGKSTDAVRRIQTFISGTNRMVVKIDKFMSELDQEFQRLGITPPGVEILLQEYSSAVKEPEERESKATPVNPETPLRNLGLRTRTINPLWVNGINTVGHVLRMTDEDLLLYIKNFGRNALWELKEKMSQNGFPPRREADNRRIKEEQDQAIEMIKSSLGNPGAFDLTDDQRRTPLYRLPLLKRYSEQSYRIETVGDLIATLQDDLPHVMLNSVCKSLYIAGIAPKSANQQETVS